MTLYEILQIRQTATPNEVRRAYLRLVKVYHPDVNPVGAETFKRVQEAYETLSDASRRMAYDMGLNKPKTLTIRVGTVAVNGQLYFKAQDVVNILADAYRFYGDESIKKLHDGFIKLGNQRTGR